MRAALSLWCTVIIAVVQVHARECEGGDGDCRSGAGGLFAGRQDMSKYHASKEIFAQIEQLTGSCKYPLTTTRRADSQHGGELFVARLGEEASAKKVMIVANEHARELVTAEVVLNFLQSACKQSSPGLPSGLEYIILPVVNEHGRRLVETGQSVCQRLTTEAEGAVDLNRNMDVDWGRGDAESPGSNPFSAYQTRILRDLAAEIQPSAFIDVHSGRRELITSWGFRHSQDPDFQDQRKVLNLIKDRHCPDCAIGSGWEVIGYESPGEIIDHMYLKQGVKYSTLWEIYEDVENEGDCVQFFNPPDSLYDMLMGNWTAALFSFGEYVAKHVHKDERSRPWAKAHHKQNVLAAHHSLMRVEVRPHGDVT
mmetsp:Transcript_2466/g.5339  ORF Transcript_2466/g.5339 Transcript_2466/m.5339 type:complete len:367 (-) Transcript_2466:69-1169(-)|eukprot:CAMPEP_0178381464 /NCGR_PEP_ID=MMETSP0689_2-20121128/5995_1 /TAXON_ID=160604 /ORGANISM="Amphidinium massartii, Strain CS-259" /LENGTH=366 /DNA_ID=CAMNT_0020001645 /DNA_START=93 /DNA_END=1193 /DNA_ORIENTATION=-